MVTTLQEAAARVDAYLVARADAKPWPPSYIAYNFDRDNKERLLLAADLRLLVDAVTR